MKFKIFTIEFKGTKDECSDTKYRNLCSYKYQIRNLCSHKYQISNWTCKIKLKNIKSENQKIIPL